MVLSVALQKPSCGSKESKGKRKEIESNSDSSPRKPTTHRRRAVVYESDDEGNSEEVCIPVVK